MNKLSTKKETKCYYNVKAKPNFHQFIISFLLMFMFFFLWDNNFTFAFSDKEPSLDYRVIESEKSFREVSGLNTSEAHIIEVIRDKKNKNSIEKYGVHLTDEEMKEVEKILEIDEYLPNVRKMIGETEEQPSEIASFSADYRNKKFHIYLTEGDSRSIDVKSRLINSFPYPEMLDFHYVKYSHLELKELADKIEIWSEVKGSKIINKTVDIKRNQVVLGVDPYKEDIIDFYQLKYGDMVHIEQGEIEKEEARTTPQYHMQGGLQIGSTPAISLGAFGYCTLGYTAHKNGQDYLVTAGHCINKAKARGESSWYQGGEIIGASAEYGENYYYDVGLIKLTSSKNATNYIYKYNSFDSKYTRETNGSAYVGQPICISGAYSNFQCGEVLNPGRETTVQHSNGNLYTAYRAQKSYTSAGGDSGSPVWYGGILIGIHTSTSSFSHLETFKNQLGIDAIVRY